MTEHDAGPIVVGVDGSAHSIAALRWSLGEAARRDCAVRAVIAWQNEPEITRPAPILIEPESDQEIIKAHRKVLDDAMTQVGDIPGKGVEVHYAVIRGAAQQVLVDAAGDAQLLVVGSHGRSQLMQMLLGSVSAYCVRHAHCPVVVIPALMVPEQHRPTASTAAAPEPLTPGPLL